MERDTEGKQQERRGDRNGRKWNERWFGLQAGEMLPYHWKKPAHKFADLWSLYMVGVYRNGYFLLFISRDSYSAGICLEFLMEYIKL